MDKKQTIQSGWIQLGLTICLIIGGVVYAHMHDMSFWELRGFGSACIVLATWAIFRIIKGYLWDHPRFKGKNKEQIIEFKDERNLMLRGKAALFMQMINILITFVVMVVMHYNDVDPKWGVAVFVIFLIQFMGPHFIYKILQKRG